MRRYPSLSAYKGTLCAFCDFTWKVPTTKSRKGQLERAQKGERRRIRFGRAHFLQNSPFLASLSISAAKTVRRTTQRRHLDGVAKRNVVGVCLGQHTRTHRRKRSNAIVALQQSRIVSTGVILVEVRHGDVNTMSAKG